MNSIRQSLAGPHGKMSYYGFSYGTYLGQVYATLYLHTLNQLILDSNVDPRNVWYKANLNQNRQAAAAQGQRRVGPHLPAAAGPEPCHRRLGGGGVRLGWLSGRAATLST
jgi:pimeloyl-ACP methyl ester carboxylesterase